MTIDAGEGDRQRIDTLAAPYGREIRLEDVRFESGMHLMRLTIREGRRFTILDIDPQTAARWGRLMTDWAAAHEGTAADPAEE